MNTTSRSCCLIAALLTTAFALAQDINPWQQLKEADKATNSFRKCQVHLQTAQAYIDLDDVEGANLIRSLNLSRKKNMVSKNPDLDIILQLDSVELDKPKYTTRNIFNYVVLAKQNMPGKEYTISMAYMPVIKILFVAHDTIMKTVRIIPESKLSYSYQLNTTNDVSKTWDAQKDINIEEEMRIFQLNFLKNKERLLISTKKTLEQVGRHK